MLQAWPEPLEEPDEPPAVQHRVAHRDGAMAKVSGLTDQPAPALSLLDQRRNR
jgi:hypothetical protein